jgi:drug/metabolite transporter (DMT)-like permease
VLRHEFRPGRLVAGAAFALAGIVYAGDAGGLWETPWFAVIPMVVGGLCLAGATGVLTRYLRRRRAARPGTPAQAGADTAT